MQAQNHINYKKTNLDKFKEFFHALRIIYDSRQLISQGKYYQITPIYGQLRALLTDKTKERNKELKPFFDIANLLGEEIEIFHMPNFFQKEVEPKLNGTVLLHVSSLPISIEKLLPFQEKITIEDYLQFEVVKFNGNYYKVFEIINALSDKYGGSHYDSKVPQYLMDLASFGFNNQPILDNLIIQIADLFIQIGLRLIKKLSDFEFFFSIHLEKREVEEYFLFDYTLPNSSCRISFYNLQGKLRLFLTDIIGRSVNFEIKQIVDIGELQFVNISHRITIEFKSEVKISINGINVFEGIINEPLLMVNEINNFQCYINKSNEKGPQDYEFGLGEIIIMSNIVDDFDRAKIYLHMTQKETSKILWFHKNGFAHSAPGIKDLKMEGNVELIDYPLKK